MKKTILIVDDNDLSIQFLSALLNSIGIRVLTAENGAEALQAAAEGHPDVIFMDIELDGESGRDITRALKADPRLKSIPVVALSGLMPDREHDPSVFADFIRKPASIPVLRTVLSRVLAAD